MAKLEVRPIPTPPKEFVLTLTEDEASALKALIGSTGGIHEIKKFFFEIYNLLDKAGVPDTYYYAIRTTAKVG